MCQINEIFNHISQALEQLLQNEEWEDHIDTYLERREQADFDKSWASADKSLEAMKTQGIDDFNQSEQKLREQVFKRVAVLTKNYDLAAYLSDDAGLIYTNLVFEGNNPFVNQLYGAYKLVQLP
ncbi:hypothetical protein A4G20_03170 [Pasteurellaceae bacterium RH1A]|nr:hypothetical protein A4G20_03170 [Pasteurellaceae bacterium RH1A]